MANDIDVREIEAIYAAAILDQTDRHDRPQIGFPRTTEAVRRLIEREVSQAVDTHPICRLCGTRHLAGVVCKPPLCTAGR